jgi:hypothetical protein
VLPRFSAGLRIRKILPSLVEEMKDAALLPAILPNVFAVARELKQAEFGAVVLPSLRPLFGVRDPPANMLVLLEHLGLLQEKTDKVTFRQAVLPLVYNALESEHAVVSPSLVVMSLVLIEVGVSNDFHCRSKKRRCRWCLDCASRLTTLRLRVCCSLELL